MSDWWHSNPGNSGWFATFTPPWRDPTNGTYQRHVPPAGWRGEYRPHWQLPRLNVTGPFGNGASRTGERPPLSGRALRSARRRHALVALSIMLVPYLWHLDRMLPVFKAWIGD